jgi:hypothetical protein
MGWIQKEWMYGPKLHRLTPDFQPNFPLWQDAISGIKQATQAPYFGAPKM